MRRLNVAFTVLCISLWFHANAGELIFSKINIIDMMATSKADVVTSPIDIGTTVNCFDGLSSSIIRSAAVNPAFVTITFTEPQSVRKLKVLLGQPGYSLDVNSWKVEAANSESDLLNQVNSYTLIVDTRDGVAGEWDEASLSNDVTATIWRFTLTRTNGDNYVHIRDLELYSATTIDSLYFSPADDLELLSQESYQLSVKGVNKSLNQVFDITGDVDFNISMPDVVNVTDTAGFIYGSSQGTIKYIASLGSLADTVNVSVKDTNDLTVAYIKRLPEIDYVENSTDPTVEGWPAPGQQVVWRAYVKNLYGSSYTNVGYEFLLDGQTVQSGLVDVPAFGVVAVDLDQQWDFARHELEFVIDANDAIQEFSERNNSLITYTNAITLDFYVEHSVYKRFRSNQNKLGVGTNCFDDWLQILNLQRWNQMFEEAVYPETPNGVIDRIRIDSIIVVPDNTLPLNGGTASGCPDKLNKTVDLQWGLYYQEDIVSNPGRYSDYYNTEDTNPFYYAGWILHELGHTRYLVDIYAWNVHISEANIPFSEDGVPVAGSEYIPKTGTWNDQYYVAPITGLMHHEYTYIDRYSAVMLNAKAGERALAQNFHYPDDIGVTLRQLPETLKVFLKDEQGMPLKNANVKVYQSQYWVGKFYGKDFHEQPDFEFTADNDGAIIFTENPFYGIWDNDVSNSPVDWINLIRIETTKSIGYEFFPSIEPNIAYQNGQTNYYEMNLTFTKLIEKETVVGVDSYNKDDMTIYPNPANGIVSINFDAQLPEKISVVNIFGECVMQLTDNFIEIDLSGQVPGIYFLKFQYPDRKVIKRVMIQ